MTASRFFAFALFAFVFFSAAPPATAQDVIGPVALMAGDPPPVIVNAVIAACGGPDFACSGTRGLGSSGENNTVVFTGVAGGACPGRIRVITFTSNVALTTMWTVGIACPIGGFSGTDVVTIDSTTGPGADFPSNGTATVDGVDLRVTTEIAGLGMWDSRSTWAGIVTVLVATAFLLVRRRFA